MERLVQQDTDPATLQRARNLALRTAFREVDRDNNGALDCDELLTLLRRVTLTHVSVVIHMLFIYSTSNSMHCMLYIESWFWCKYGMLLVQVRMSW
jgi:EF hand